MVRLIPLAVEDFGCSLPQTELGASWRGTEGGCNIAQKLLGWLRERLRGEKEGANGASGLKGG